MFTFCIVTSNATFDARTCDVADLAHGTAYRIRIIITDPKVRRGNASITIDGKNGIGTWRVDGGVPFEIDRPADISRQFIFYELGTSEADQAGLSASPELGEVTVTFTPELVQEVMRGCCLRGGQSFGAAPTGGAQYRSAVPKGAGGTGLGPESQQKFSNAAPISLDYSNRSSLTIKLVARRPIIPLRCAPRPELGSVSDLLTLIEAAQPRDRNPKARPAMGYVPTTGEFMTSKGARVWTNRSRGYTTIERPDVQSVESFARLTNVSTKRKLAPDGEMGEFMGPVLTGRKIDGAPSHSMFAARVVYREAMFEDGSTIWYTPVSWCGCQGKCDGTCNRLLVMHVAEIIHPGTTCNVTGMSPIAGPRFMHRRKQIDVNWEVFNKLPADLQEDFDVLEYQDNCSSGPVPPAREEASR